MNLEGILKQDKPYVFTMIHKFNQEVDPADPYSPRDDIIVISDEAHRTQYGRLALNMRNALPNANYIGSTGTPLFKDDEITKKIFGDYVSTYDFQRAVDDQATVPLYYDNRGEKLKITTTEINERLAEKLEETELDPDQTARLEADLARDYNVITSSKRLTQAKEVINQSEETRKRFEILAREVFKKFKACLTIKSVNEHKDDHDAIDIIYKKLQDDRDQADISEIIWELHRLVDAVIEIEQHDPPADSGRTFDISKIDFERLKEEFRKWDKKNTTTQCLKTQIEMRLKRMMERNPLRTDFHKRYQEIIADYNQEKDRLTIEDTFAALLKFVEELDVEETRAIREGLDEESLALFDLLAKPELSTRDRNRLKKVATELLAALKGEKLRIDNWREKEATKAEVRVFIHDFLYRDDIGLPAEAYSPQEVEERADVIFAHVFFQYSGPQPVQVA